MEATTNIPGFAFDSPKGQSSYIKVIGVGGGGGNAVNHMFREGIEGVDFIVCNTDMKALSASPVPNKIPLGTLGLGAGGKPEKARKAAEAKVDDIREALSHNTQMLFITAGMGGGTGTGAAPVIAEVAKSIDLENEENEKILVVAIVTRPFSFEGEERCTKAEEGIKELSKYVDSIIVINNDKLRSFGNLTKSNAFAIADDILLTAARSIANIITKEGIVNRDFQDVKTVMEFSGTALMGTGCGKGENRAKEAIEAATNSPLLDDSNISGAKNVLLYFSYSHEHEMTIDEMTEVTDYVYEVTGGKAKLLWGDCFDDTLGEDLKVILIATGFEKKTDEEVVPVTHALEDEKPAEKVKEPAPVESNSEMTLIHKEETPQPVESVNPERKEEPVPVVEEVKPQPAPAPAEPTRHVYTLDEPIDNVNPDAEALVKPATSEPVGDVLVEEIHIKNPEPVNIVPEPRPTPQPAPVNPRPRVDMRDRPSTPDEYVALASERIAHIHDILRNNPNGAELVQNMKTADIIEGRTLYTGEHSSARESSSMRMNPDGTLSQNPYVYKETD